MAIYEKDFRVDFDKIDENNQMSNHGFLDFFQEIGILHSDQAGYGLKDIPTTHVAWILLNWKLKVFTRPKWNDFIHIKTWSRSMDKFHAYRDFEMYDKDGNRIAIATSKWTLYNTQTGRITPIPQDIFGAYNSALASVFEEFEERLKEPEEYDFSKTYTVQRRDIDTNHHMNNLAYLNYGIETLPEKIYQKMNFSQVEIMYKRATLLGESFITLFKQISNQEIMAVVKSPDSKILHAIIRLTN